MIPPRWAHLNANLALGEFNKATKLVSRFHDVAIHEGKFLAERDGNRQLSDAHAVKGEKAISSATNLIIEQGQTVVRLERRIKANLGQFGLTLPVHE